MPSVPSNGGVGLVGRYPALTLFVLAFSLYNANLREISSYDTMATRMIPVSLLGSGDLNLDEFGFFYSGEYPTSPVVRDDAPMPERTPYWVQYRRGHYMPTFPAAAGILVTPVYAPAAVLGLLRDEDRVLLLATLLAKISASLLAALSVGVVYLMARRLTGPREGVWVAVIYGFCTSTWAVSSQGLWQVAVSQPFLVFALYALVRVREARPDESRWLALAGLFFALAVAARPPNAVPAVVMSLYVLHSRPRRLHIFAAAPIVVATALFAHNLYWYDTLLGGYAATSVGGTVGAPSLAALAGLMISPSRGLFVFSPVLLFVLPGVRASLRDRRETLPLYSFAALVSLIVLYSSWRYWHGHHAWGYRHLIDALPFFALLLTLGIRPIIESRPARRALVAAAIFSLTVQFVGAFNYPCGWDSGIDPFENQERLWSVTDTQIMRCLLSGPVYPDGLRLLTGAEVGTPVPDPELP
jgi:hypothetical protein